MMASEPVNGSSLPCPTGTSSAAAITSVQPSSDGAKERKERQMRRLTAEMDDLRAK